MTEVNDHDDSLLPTVIDADPLDFLETVANGVKIVDPIVSRLAKFCVDLARERRLEIEARLAARLQELLHIFAKLDELRASEMADRELQSQTMSALLDVAKASRDPQLIMQAMQCFQEYVRSAPKLTRDFCDAMSVMDVSLGRVPTGSGS